jgi:hypothetical protein
MGILGFKSLLPVIFGFFVLGSIGFSQDAFALTCTSSGVSGDWAAMVWSGTCGAKPVAGDTVTITAGDTVSVTTAEAATSFSVSGTLNIAAGGTLTVSSLSIVSSTGTLNNGGTLTGTGSDLRATSGGTLNNLATGTITTFDDLDLNGGAGGSTITNACGGTINVGSAGPGNFIRMLGGPGHSLTNAGVLTVLGGFTNPAGGTFTNNGVYSFGAATAPFTDNGNSCLSAGPLSGIFALQSGDGSPSSAKPTLGKAKSGVLAVEGGFCFNLYCVDVLEYFTHFNLQQINSDESFTITLTGYFPAGVDRANYASIGAAPTGGDINDSTWFIEAKRVGATDQWDVIVTDENGNLGTVTVAVQKVDNNIASFSFTIQSHTPASFGDAAGGADPADDNQILVTEIRDNRGNSVRNIFNEGFFVNDVYAYPQVQADFEEPLKVDRLCLNEDSTDRHTCAFDKVKDWTIAQAEQTLAEMYGKNYQGTFAESEQYGS